MRPYLITLTGPSCSGKTTLENMLKEHGFSAIKSTTTRPMREGDVNGQTYDFITKDEFRAKQASGEFIESVEFAGNLYGATVSEVTAKAAAGRPIVLVCEPNGAGQIMGYSKVAGWRHLSIFITNPTELVLKRFLNRALADKPADYDKWMDTLVGRIHNMTAVESKWIGDLSAYDLYIPRFNAENASGIAGKIANIVFAAMDAGRPILPVAPAQQSTMPLAGIFLVTKVRDQAPAYTFTR